MKRHAVIIGYECIFDFPSDEWQLPQPAVERMAGLMELEGIAFDRSRLSLLLRDALERRRSKAAETMTETKFKDIVASVMEDLEVSDPSMNQRIVDAASMHCAEHSRAKRGAAELLLRLKKEMKVGLVCNVPLGLPHSIIASQIREAGLAASVDDMQFSTEMGMRRPHARQFRYSLSNLNAEPSECAAITAIAEDRETLSKLSFGDIFIMDAGGNGVDWIAETIEHLCSML